MSTLTQRKCLEGVRPGSVGYVVGHARWRKSRGKKPSLPFNGEMNPKLALRMASEEFNKLISLAKFWLGKLRGDDPALYQLDHFRKNALKAGLSPGHFQTDDKELDDLRLRCHENTAKFWLGKVKSDDPASYQLEFFKKHFSETGKTLGHFGTSEKELGELERKIVTRK